MRQRGSSSHPTEAIASTRRRSGASSTVACRSLRPLVPRMLMDIEPELGTSCSMEIMKRASVFGRIREGQIAGGPPEASTAGLLPGAAAEPGACPGPDGIIDPPRDVDLDEEGGTTEGLSPSAGGIWCANDTWLSFAPPRAASRREAARWSPAAPPRLRDPAVKKSMKQTQRRTASRIQNTQALAPAVLACSSISTVRLLSASITESIWSSPLRGRPTSS
mmetsp:Transcript_53946/g.115862  ORF Transcript_53946/g.115862 Transcript_53946/m.115862 type:complete len:220 (+) Transcript_53946:641-1300(+)